MTIFFLFFFCVRRDLKCENLLLDANYSIKLSDFGFARDNMIKKNGKIKTSKTFCGSYAYASPEILNCIPYQPNASDIWSIGIILYAIMYKALPFNDPDPDKLIKVSGPDCLKYNNIIVNSNKVVKYYISIIIMISSVAYAGFSSNFLLTHY